MNWLAAVKNNPLVWPQGDHFLLGLCTMLLCWRFGQRRRFWLTYLILGLSALFIEAVYDPRYEHDPFLSLTGGALDLSCYLIGGAAGWLVDRSA